MRFASDNAFGVHESMLAALRRVNDGVATSYGADDESRSVETRMSEIFECDVTVFLVATGTAANAIALSTLTPPYGAVLCHPESHIMVDECGAPEFYCGGAKLVPVWGEDGKISADALRDSLDGLIVGEQHQVQAAALSLTQVTEAGTVYTVDEIGALAGMARERSMKVHMDGARFANAVVATGASPADLTWRAGVDVLSFGATKNGAMGAEAVVLFDRSLSDDFMYRRKRGGHLISKGRFVAAQFSAYFDEDLWLDLARHANAMARRFAEGIEASDVARLAYPVQANEAFVFLPEQVHVKLQAAGAIYSQWPGAGPQDERRRRDGEVLVRMVTSFQTPESDVDQFLSALSDCST